MVPSKIYNHRVKIFTNFINIKETEIAYVSLIYRVLKKEVRSFSKKPMQNINY